MLTLIADRFNEDDSIDFIYSGYRFNHDTLNVYPSRPFDPYLLESFNYISTMSPMKRKVFSKVGGFREDLPYFIHPLMVFGLHEAGPDAGHRFPVEIHVIPFIDKQGGGALEQGQVEIFLRGQVEKQL